MVLTNSWAMIVVYYGIHVKLVLCATLSLCALVYGLVIVYSVFNTPTIIIIILRDI